MYVWCSHSSMLYTYLHTIIPIINSKIEIAVCSCGWNMFFYIFHFDARHTFIYAIALRKTKLRFSFFLCAGVCICAWIFSVWFNLQYDFLSLVLQCVHVYTNQNSNPRKKPKTNIVWRMIWFTVEWAVVWSLTRSRALWQHSVCHLFYCTMHIAWNS